MSVHAIVAELIGAGHRVLGLARSDAGAKSLIAAGGRGASAAILKTSKVCAVARAGAEGVIHCGFVHDFSRFEEVCEIDRHAIEALGGAIAGSDRPFVVTSGTATALTPGRLTTEDEPPNSPLPRVASEEAGNFHGGAGPCAFQ